MHIAFTLVDYEVPVLAALVKSSTSVAASAVSFNSVATKTASPMRRRKGLCTNWLLTLCEEAGLLVEHTRSKKEVKKQQHRLITKPNVIPARKAASSCTSISPDHATVVMETLPSIRGLPGCYRMMDSRLSIPVFVRRSIDFSLPSDISKPIIMVTQYLYLCTCSCYSLCSNTVVSYVLDGITGWPWYGCVPIPWFLTTTS